MNDEVFGAGGGHDDATDHFTLDYGGVHSPVAAAGDRLVSDRSNGSHCARDDRVVAGITDSRRLNAISFRLPGNRVGVGCMTSHVR
jgi:hypothetical protein